MARSGGVLHELGSARGARGGLLGREGGERGREKERKNEKLLIWFFNFTLRVKLVPQLSKRPIRFLNFCF